MTTLANFRPRSALEIVDGTFTLFREHFATLVAISAVIRLPFAIAAFLVPEAYSTLVDRSGNLFVAIAYGATAVLIYQSLAGKRLDLGESFGGIQVTYGTLVFAQLLSGLMIAFGTVLLVIPGIIAFIWTAVAIPAAAIEGHSSTEAISRSRNLARTNAWHILGTMVLAWGVLLVIMIATIFGLGMLAGASGLGERVSQLLLQMVIIVLMPIPSVATTLLYVDLRVRREALDVEATLDMLAASTPAGTA